MKLDAQMKRIRYVLFILILTQNLLLAQEARTNSLPRIAASEATNHLDSEAIIFGKVVEVYTTEKLIRINLDKPFPKQSFTAVIFSSNTNSFSNLDKLKGKTIEVSGKVTQYRDKPQIVLTSTNQLRIVEKASENEKKSP